MNLNIKKITFGLLIAVLALVNTACQNKNLLQGKKNESVAALQLLLLGKKSAVPLSGTIYGNVTLDASLEYLLRGTVVIASGATLNIPAGTKIYGAVSPAGSLLVKQGGKINAVGTAAKPIVFTSEKEVGNRATGDWQGIILQGNGIQTLGGPGSQAIGEGDVGNFGGTNNNDSSGTMKYVRIEFAGSVFSPGNERNCLSLMGIGSGTTLEYIQCHRSNDDGFEFWGGAVNAKYLMSSGSRDDYFDFADGFIGKIQYAIGHFYAEPIATNDDTSRCIEGDGRGGTNTCSGSARSGGECSQPYMANITCIGSGTSTKAGDGLYLRRASGNNIGDYTHFQFIGFNTLKAVNCITTAGQTATASLSNLYALNSATSATSCSPSFGTSVNITTNSQTAPNFAPAASNVIGTTVKNVSNFNDSFFDNNDFYGAIRFGGTDWTSGWTSYPAN